MSDLKKIKWLNYCQLDCRYVWFLNRFYLYRIFTSLTNYIYHISWYKWHWQHIFSYVLIWFLTLSYIRVPLRMIFFLFRTFYQQLLVVYTWPCLHTYTELVYTPILTLFVSLLWFCYTWYWDCLEPYTEVIYSLKMYLVYILIMTLFTPLFWHCLSSYSDFV